MYRMLPVERYRPKSLGARGTNTQTSLLSLMPISYVSYWLNPTSSYREAQQATEQDRKTSRDSLEGKREDVQLKSPI